MVKEFIMSVIFSCNLIGFVSTYLLTVSAKADVDIHPSKMAILKKQ
ncbi:hypothetical protein CLG_0117 (plasmid) [Clostridium botulinum D str. 1873]|uniref:Uncharacterized protein n=2 Tax=Clostridiaceae TaxID=31979 RepID=A0A9N7B8N7_CLOBO|nr:hypothetical protein CLG_0117 [Clostridium botulinum D str. 1873]